MKMRKSTAEFTYCGEDKDAEEESGRLKLQTAKEGGRVSFVCGATGR